MILLCWKHLQRLVHVVPTRYTGSPDSAATATKRYTYLLLVKSCYIRLILSDLLK